MARELSPSASAVFWLFTALGDELGGMQTKRLIELSKMGESSFHNGAREAEARGLIERKRTGYELKKHAELHQQSNTCSTEKQ